MDKIRDTESPQKRTSIAPFLLFTAFLEDTSLEMDVEIPEEVILIAMAYKGKIS